MTKPESLSVTNLIKYQHYKTRNPPWVKLHRNFWVDYKIKQLTVQERLLFLGCLTLASESENQFPNDPKYLAQRLGFPVTQKMIEHLLSLTLLCLFSSLSLSLSLSKQKSASCLQDASTPLAPCKQIASKMLADKTSKGLTSIGLEVKKVTEKIFPPI